MALKNYYFGGSGERAPGERASNPWPTPPKQSGGAFGSGNSGRSSEQQQQQPLKKFGGGFGSSIGAPGAGFGGSLSGRSGGGGWAETCLEKSSTSFLSYAIPERKEITGFNVSRGGFGVGGGAFGGSVTSSASRLLTSEPSSIALMDIKSDERCVTPKSSDNVVVVAGNISASRRGGFGNSPRSSEVMSPSKRSRTGRRTGRRGPRGPGHCFHCQEHGHISRECPKKAADTDDIEESATGGGGGTETDRFMYQLAANESAPPTPASQTALPSLTTRDAHLNAKLENLKQRESYYAGYGYGKSTTTSTTTVTNGGGGAGISPLLTSSSNTGFESGRCSAIGAAAGAQGGGVVGGIGGGAGGSIKSPEIDKFSEQLDNALKLHYAESPRGLTTQVEKGGAGGAAAAGAGGGATTGGGAASRIASNKQQQQQHEMVPIKSNSLPVRDPIKDISSSEILTIETRRIVMREGECHLEETTIINFPRLLPSNVRVITAQFVPVTTP